MKKEPFIQNIELSFQGFDIEVRGYFEKGEPAVHYPVDSAYPGSSDRFIIQEVFDEGEKLLEWLPDGSPIDWDLLEEKILTKITG